MSRCGTGRLSRGLRGRSGWGILLLLLVAGGTAKANPMRCERVDFPVAFAPDTSPTERIAGWFCARGAAHNKTIQVLIHGGTYDHNYWDYPYQPEIYSYARYITDAGYAVLNIDRLGDGESSHPVNAAALDLHVGAFAVHQVVQSLRSGHLNVPGFGRIEGKRILLVGHSLGALTSGIEASQYQDVDGVILTGIAHFHGMMIDIVNSEFVTAVDDPKFASSGLPFDYVTTPAGRRGFYWYHAPNADPAVIALDESLKQTATNGEAPDVGPALGATLGVQVPVMVAVGDFDRMVCGIPSCTASGTIDSEAAAYSPSAAVEVNVIPDSAHDINLHKNARVFFDIAREWADRKFGSDIQR
jgi:pimeloyl-ACP methyl ester carboxylesterase